MALLGGWAVMDWSSSSLGLLGDLVRGLYAAGAAMFAAAMVLGLIEAWRETALRVLTAAFAVLGTFWLAAILLRIGGGEAPRPSVVVELPGSIFFALFMWTLGSNIVSWWAERRGQPTRTSR
ncbi:hypothetical protein [Neoroseomonas soli]|uniref:Uncharacterized protein n=1 Tax=Neoroseomonas soli TaxID=1081025 RepID=A0A9X9X095_9PROT|nr:hypothetical protein [Neoroseomonas soli]MBR0672824.1 hypothetical protein [Neoroseomonas soli]